MHNKNCLAPPYLTRLCTPLSVVAGRTHLHSADQHKLFVPACLPRRLVHGRSSFFQSVLRWSVAVSTICHHSSRVVAFLQAVARPKFRGPRSASIARRQVWPGLPIGCFRSVCTCRIVAARAQWWSSRDELRAIWPKSRRRLLVTR